MTLAEFLTERLNDDEQEARTASAIGRVVAPVWRQDGDHLVATERVTPPPAKPGVRAWTPPQYQVAEVDAVPGEHIARHNPARVLAFVAAGRAILDVHCGPDDEARRLWPQYPAHCVGCDYSDSDASDGSSYDPNATHRDYCPTLRAFALTWADHPDYREEWR